MLGLLLLALVLIGVFYGLWVGEGVVPWCYCFSPQFFEIFGEVRVVYVKSEGLVWARGVWCLCFEVLL